VVETAAQNPVGPLVQVRDLKKYFPIKRGMLGRVVGHVKAVDGVSFDILPGECLALVGESGSGKTTVGKTLLRAYGATSGRVLMRVDDQMVDVATLHAKQLKPLRRHMQMIFQDPYASLNPRMTVREIISEPLLVHGMGRSERRARVRQLITQVGLNTDHLVRYPHAFSGGQRQRIGIARALALNPRFIVADEPVSALDVSVQAQVINLLQKLQVELGLTYLFIAHDLSVVRHISDRVAVMYLGKIVEVARVESIFDRPRHPYTEALLAAVPMPDPKRKSQHILLRGEVGDPSNPPPGCSFHPRCAYCQDRCRTEIPALCTLADGHQSACHFAEQLSLRGMAE
jgi:peptide/nickel transport system ATP-binding protein